MVTDTRVPSPVAPLVPRATSTPDCTGNSNLTLQKPPPGSQCWVGETITIGWNGGAVLKNTGYKRGVAWKGYLVRGNYPNSFNITIFDTEIFVAGDARWDSENLFCGGSDSQIEYNWTIPANLLLHNTGDIYRYLLVKELEGVFKDPVPHDMAQFQDDVAKHQDGSPLPPSTSFGDYFSIFPATSALKAISTTPTTSTTSTTSTTPTTPTTPVTPTTPTPKPAPAPAPGLSLGDKAGIGVGVALGALSCLAAGVYFLRWWRRTRRTRTTQKTMATTEGQVRYEKHELDASEPERQQRQAFEADGKPLAELTGENAPRRYYRPQEELVELPGNDVL
ncbi:hypothetical protein PG984_000253 [Apiospora sp. TS-2023a]